MVRELVEQWRSFTKPSGFSSSVAILFAFHRLISTVGCLVMSSPIWLAILLSFVLPGPARSQAPQDGSGSCFALIERQVCIGEENYRADVCAAISTYADHWHLPEGFFARLVWQESRFDPTAVSPAGAQGIAQFMPSTGHLRNLSNAFDPAEALARSAEYLHFLERKFGNLGLAAAAYNGGEGRMERYIANGGSLPLETRNYVMTVTGWSIDTWLASPPQENDYALDDTSDFHTACLDMARSVRAPLFMTQADWQPWGVLIAQRASPEMARSGFTVIQAEFENVLQDEQMMLIAVRNPNFGNALRYSAMVGFESREGADALCERLRAAGGNCIVQKNAP